MSTKAKCAICGKVLDTRGIHGHIILEHPGELTKNHVNNARSSENVIARNSVSDKRTSVNCENILESSEKTLENDNTQVSQLAEQESSIAQLREEVT